MLSDVLLDTKIQFICLIFVIIIQYYYNIFNLHSLASSCKSLGHMWASNQMQTNKRIVINFRIFPNIHRIALVYFMLVCLRIIGANEFANEIRKLFQTVRNNQFRRYSQWIPDHGICTLLFTKLSEHTNFVTLLSFHNWIITHWIHNTQYTTRFSGRPKLHGHFTKSHIYLMRRIATEYNLSLPNAAFEYCKVCASRNLYRIECDTWISHKVRREQYDFEIHIPNGEINLQQ